MSEYFFLFNNFVILIETNFFISFFLFFVFILLYSTISLPGLLIVFVFAGYLFGLFFGFLACIFGVTFGSMVFFTISKYILSKYFKKFYSYYVDKVNIYLKNSTLEYLLIFRMIPGPPLMIQNLLLSILNISYFKFFFATVIGMSPLTFFAVLLGNKLNNLQEVTEFKTSNVLTWDLFLVIIVAIFLLIFRIIYKKTK